MVTGCPSAQMLEVGANTRVRDACDSIAARLQLASWEGCSLFIKIADKVCGPQAKGREGRRLKQVGVSHLHWASPRRGTQAHRREGSQSPGVTPGLLHTFLPVPSSPPAPGHQPEGGRLLL